MTISKPQIKKKISPPTLQLSGSQINLSPRPMPVTHVTWSSSYRSYPIRRSVSAFGFQQVEEEHPHVNSRPLSADNIRYINRRSSVSDFHHSEITISSSNQDFNETCLLSENVFENILNGYSESKRISEYQNAESNLKPGLSSKPPLPPFNAESKSNANNKSESDMENLDERVVPVENIKTAAEKEAFDEIIALKFQRWFPNTSSHLPEDFSSEGETNDVELLSYKERNYQTCEYRYEILKKNNTKKANEKRNAGVICKTKKSKKIAPKTGATTSPINSISSPRSTPPPNDTKIPSNNYRREITTVSNTHLPQGRNSVAEIEIKHDTVEINDKTINMMEEQDYRKISQKFATNPDRNDERYEQNSTLKEIDSKPKQLKTSFLKKSNLQSPLTSPLKKQKKISFSVDKRNDVEDQKEDFVEPYFATKMSNSEKKISHTEKSYLSDENVEDNRKYCDRNEGRSKIRDLAVSPQQPAGSQIEDVLSWMGAHRTTGNSKMGSPETDMNNSMYDEMIDILKDIEKEDINGQTKHEAKLDDIPSRNVTPSSPAKAIWSLIEEAEKHDDIIHGTDFDYSSSDGIRMQDIRISDRSPNAEEKNWNRLSDLLRFPSTELAQKVMALQLLLDERETVLQNLNARLKSTEQTYQQQKQELEYSVHKQHKHIEQLKNEKRSINDRLENTVREMEKRHAAALIALDEKHKIELKKSLEKQAASDKLEREKWLEMKTQKIKEFAIKGLEPELNRMAATHQQEIAEIRKFHKTQIEEIEEAFNRRITVQREKLEAETQKAVAIEREISRQKLEDEIGELEKRYQDQRKRLLAEVHVERENIERENSATLAIREKENERKWEIKSIEMQKKIEALQNQHQDEIKKLQLNFETEKQIWMKNQMMDLSEKENKIKEQCKKERDKHIELIIQKLENENIQREQNNEQKIKRLKEQYEAEIRDMEMANENLRRKLNESRDEIQKSEETVSQLRAQLNQSQTEYVILKEKYDRLLIEQGEMQNMAKSELATRIHILQSELNQAHLTYESQIKSLKSENERELSQVYSRVKEMILKKDDLINTLKKQKDVALQQCNQLEKLLEIKRKDHSHN